LLRKNYELFAQLKCGHGNIGDVLVDPGAEFLSTVSFTAPTQNVGLGKKQMASIAVQLLLPAGTV